MSGLPQRARLVLYLLVILTAAAFASAATFTVTNTNDSGAGSLRAAMTSANGGATGDTIVFAIGSGVQTIRPVTPLPGLLNGTLLDGRTQPGFSGAPIVEIDCSLLALSYPDACIDAEQASVIRSLVINNSSAAGVSISDGSALYGSYIGTDVTGKLARRNSTGVMLGTGIVGGSAPGDGNLISGNGTGIDVRYWSSHVWNGATIAGNRIGTDATGTVALSNPYNDISVYRLANVTIGGSTPAHGNLIAGSQNAISISTSRDIAIQNNTIGLANNSSQMTGINVDGGNGVVITRNTITGMNRAAVVISGVGLRNQVRENSMSGNAAGIDLSPSYYYTDPVTPNDSDDSDTGPNNLQNFPVLTLAQSTSTATRVTGTLTSHKNTSYVVDIYANSSCSSRGHGEGQTWIGATVVNTDAAGFGSFDKIFSVPLPSGTVMTATATSTLEGTSEFSACKTLEAAGLFSIEPISGATEGSSVTLKVKRTFGSIGTVTVDYWTTAGSAGTSDFTAASGTLTFGSGETTKSVTITTLDDTTYEGNEEFTFSIGNPGGGAVIGKPSTLKVAISDNDLPPRLQINSIQVTEGNSGTTPATFTFTLTSPLPKTTTFPYWTIGHSAYEGYDFQSASGSVTFQPGETSKTVTVLVIGDTTREGNETFGMYASGSISVMNGFCTIVNDDAGPQVSIEDLSVTETDGTVTASIRVTSTQPLYSGLYYTLVERTATKDDFKIATGWFSFSGGTEKTIPLTIYGDDEPEPDEQFVVVLSQSWMPDFEVVDREGVVTIVNDDIGVGPSHQRIAVGDSATYAINLGSPVSVSTVVNLEVVGTGVTVPTSITIHPGESRASFDARATAVGSARINVILPASTHSVTATTYIGRKVTFTPNELSLYVGQTVPVTASISPAADEDITIALDAKTDAIELPSSIVIPAGGTATFDVKAIKEGPIVVHTADYAYGTSGLFGHVSTTPTTPAILRIAPPVGPTAGGTSLEVTGVHFRADCTMTFDGLPASVRYISATELEVTTPPHDEGTVDVELGCGEHLWRFTSGFTYVGASPEVTNVVPAFGNVAGGTEVRVAGANFRSSCWPFFGGVAAPRATVESATSIAATVPAHDAGTVNVLVRCTGSEALRNAAFNYTTTPEPQATIESVDPLAGAPGQPVTVTGLRFRTTDRIVFGDAAATILSTRSGQHVVRVPELPLGKTAVTLTDANGNVTTTGPIFTVLADVPPIITAIAPSSLPAGAELRLDGRGFRPGYLFRIGGKNATVASLTYTTLVLRLDPSIAPGDYDIEIYNAAANLAGIGPRVRVTSGGVSIATIDVPCATTEGGVTVTISGSGFAEGAIVRFNSVLSTEVLVVDASTLRAMVPAGEAGPSVITVANPDGSHARLTGRFKLVSPFDPNGGCSNTGRSRSVRH